MRSFVPNRRRSVRSMSSNTRGASGYGRRELLEPLETRKLLAAITSGQTLTGKINSPAQTVSYTFDASAGDFFAVSVGDTSSVSSANPYHPAFQVKGPSGTVVINAGSNGNSATAAVDDYVVPASGAGTYTVIVRDASAAASGGSFAVELDKVPGALAADSNGDGGAIASGQTKSGTINRFGDTDAFTFSAAAGQTFEVSVGDTTASTSTTQYHPYLQVIDPKGKRVVNESANGNIDTAAVGHFTVPATAAGTYTILVRDYYGSVANTTYAVELVKVPGGIAADSDGDGGAISSGQTKNAKINRFGDLDAFTFTAQPGESFEVSVGDTSPADSENHYHPYLQVIDPKGVRVINDSANGNFDTAVSDFHTVSATAGGTYTILVRDYYGSVADSTYAVELTKTPGGIAGDSNGDGGALASGQTKNGKINRFGDLDSFTFDAAAGDTFEVSVGDTSLDSSEDKYHPYLQVIDPTGKRVVNDSANGNFNTAVVGVVNVPATAAGTYTVVVRDYYGSASNGTYAVEMIKVPGGIAADANGDGGAITSGQTKSGTIQRFGDLDAFTFSASAGDTFTVALADVTPSTQVDKYQPYLQVLNPKGDRVINNSANGNSGLTLTNSYTIPSIGRGTYTVIIRDYYGSVKNGKYTLKLTGNLHPVTPVTTTITLTPPAAQTATAGVSKSFALGSFTATNATSPYTVTVNWGDGTANTAFTVSAAGTIPAQSHTYASNGSKTASITVTDSASHTSGAKTFAVTVGAAQGNTASIAGQVFNDADGDGVKDSGEVGINGVVLYNDADNDSVKDTGEATATTDSSGNYKFSSLAAGTYKIRQVLPSGFTQTSPTGGLGQGVTLTAGQAVTDKNFGDKPASANTAGISGTVFNDADGDATRDSGELGLGLWTVFIDTDKDGTLDAGEKKATTDINGAWAFAGLSAGTYVVRVVQIAGTAATTAASLTVTLTSGQASTGKLFGEKRIA